MVSDRDIEKLKAIDCTHFGARFDNDPAAWENCKAYAQGPGLKATMADKVRWLGLQGLQVKFDPPALDSPDWVAVATTVPDLKPVPGDDEVGWGDTPAAAMDALFWLVP